MVFVNMQQPLKNRGQWAWLEAQAAAHHIETLSQSLEFLLLYLHGGEKAC